MKTRTLVIGILFAVFFTGSAIAQMGRGFIGTGGGVAGTPGTGPGAGYTGSGTGYGYGVAGGAMMGNSSTAGYLGTLHPITTAAAAETAFQAFIGAASSSFQITEIWEYATVYKAELSYTTGAKAFDLIADKFTGTVTQEMGMSMMLNAGYGSGLSAPPAGSTLTVTPAQAQAAAQTFINNNRLGYTLQAVETYPGYYRFHTVSASIPASFGMDIMVNGYNGQIWMHTILGPPIAAY